MKKESFSTWQAGRSFSIILNRMRQQPEDGDDMAAAADTTAAGSEAAADTTAASGEKTVIKLGVVGENNEQWQPVIDKLAQENIDLELVKFADYPLPNRALNDGEDTIWTLSSTSLTLRMAAPRTTVMIFLSSVRPSWLR